MKPLDRVIAFSQVFLLGIWEALGVIAFGWNPFVIGAVWFVGLWTFNVLVASGVSTYLKIITPPASVANNVVKLREAEPIHINPDEAA